MRSMNVVAGEYPLLPTTGGKPVQQWRASTAKKEHRKNFHTASRLLNQGQSPSEPSTSCDCTGPIKAVLLSWHSPFPKHRSSWVWGGTGACSLCVHGTTCAHATVKELLISLGRENDFTSNKTFRGICRNKNKYINTGKKAATPLKGDCQSQRS